MVGLNDERSDEYKASLRDTLAIHASKHETIQRSIDVDIGNFCIACCACRRRIQHLHKHRGKTGTYQLDKSLIFMFKFLATLSSGMTVEHYADTMIDVLCYIEDRYSATVVKIEVIDRVLTARVLSIS